MAFLPEASRRTNNADDAEHENDDSLEAPKAVLRQKEQSFEEEDENLEVTHQDLRTVPLGDPQSSAQRVSELSRLLLSASRDAISSQYTLESKDGGDNDGDDINGMDPAFANVLSSRRTPQQENTTELEDLRNAAEEMQYKVDMRALMNRLESEQNRLTKLLSDARDASDQHKDKSERLKIIIEEMKAQRETDTIKARELVAELARENSNLQQTVEALKMEVAREKPNQYGKKVAARAGYPLVLIG